jgi:hypothetical protein
MLPSPSLGPPLLSPSPSPPPFCGMPEAGADGADVELDVVSPAALEDVLGCAAEELDDFDEPELPQPAKTSAPSSTASAANPRMSGLRRVNAFDFIARLLSLPVAAQAGEPG